MADDMDLVNALWDMATEDERAAGCWAVSFVGSDGSTVRHVVVGLTQRRLGLTPPMAVGWGVSFNPDSFLGVHLRLPQDLLPTTTGGGAVAGAVRVARSDCGTLDTVDDFGCAAHPPRIRTTKCSWLLADRIRQQWPSIVTSPAGVVHAVAEFIEHAMATWCSTCIVCGTVLDVTAALRIKPGTCAKADCCFKHEHLGVGCDVYSELRADPAVASLLLHTAVACAVNTQRAPLGFPDVMLEDSAQAQRVAKMKAAAAVAVAGGGGGGGGDGSARVPAVGVCKKPPAPRGRNKRAATTTAIVQVLTSIPTVEVLLAGAASDADLQSLLSREQHMALRWVLASHRGHVHSVDSLPAGCCLPLPPHIRQFAVRMCTNEAAFDARRASHGSFFAWHGSGLANWHSILRNGLRSLSHTQYMSSGAAHGAGIYLSDSSAVSWGYAQAGTFALFDSEAKAEDGDDDGPSPAAAAASTWACIALCEVANHPSTTKVVHTVVKEEDLVALRFLCFAPMGHKRAAVPFTLSAIALQRDAIAALANIRALSETMA